MHKSEMSKGFVKDPMTIVTVGDIVDVKVIGVDMNKESSFIYENIVKAEEIKMIFIKTEQLIQLPME